MYICYTLSMPNIGSWNGKWTGADRFYAHVINIGKAKKAVERGKEILSGKSYFYNFGDGWGASVAVKEVTAKEAASIRKKSNGFCGYEWMIVSINDIGKIDPNHK